MREFAILMLSVFIMVVIIWKGIVWVSSLECKAKAEKQGLVYEFGLLQGCMVREKGGKWIDYDRLRTMN